MAILPIPIAMPVAHVTGGPNYAGYYIGGADPIFEITEYFNERVTAATICQGFRLARNPAAPASTSAALFNLYTFTQGYLSFQNPSLVLRLPRELNEPELRQYNTSKLFIELKPYGPQLRHVVYRFDGTAPTTTIRTAIQSIITSGRHPTLSLTHVRGYGSLGAYLAGADPARLTQVLDWIMNGEGELFVNAGDVIGTFAQVPVEIRFHDSCGAFLSSVKRPVPANGRPLNPSYFLYLARHARNAANISMLTSFHAAPPSRNEMHPLEYLLSDPVLTARQASPELELNVTAATPPKPLHYTVQVMDGAGNFIADRGIAIESLGEWHESRNAANPTTLAPVRWHTYGGLAGETNRAEYGKFRSETKPGQVTRVPGQADFDHLYAPQQVHDRARLYWDRYGDIYNAVARAFEIPCELLVAVSCQETGPWFNGPEADGFEMNVIRMEPLPRAVNAITANAAHRNLLNLYLAYAGGVGGSPTLNGANPYMLVRWDANARLSGTTTLTWGDLTLLVNTYPRDAQVSPGVMQVLVRTAQLDSTWVAEMYGPNYTTLLNVTYNGVRLTVDPLPATQGAIFSQWFGVMADAAGNTTNNPAAADIVLTPMKRALHQITAGAAHIKHNYNTIEEGTGGKFNKITDFDWPTLASGHNDGAVVLGRRTRFDIVPKKQASIPADSIQVRWTKLFNMLYNNQDYPQHGTRYLNAAINHFNNNPPIQPALRLWRE